VYDLRVYFRAYVVVAALIASACFVDNGTSTADPATSSSSTGAPTGVADPTTTLDPTTLDTSSSTPPNETSTDDTTGEVPPVDCWDQDVGSWPSEGTRLELGELVEPYLTADGLHLYYLGLPERRPHLSTRASRFDPLPVGTPIADWTGLAEGLEVSAPTVLVADQLMLLSDGSDIYVSLATPSEPDKFSLPVVFPGVINTAEFQEVYATGSDDVQVLIVTRGDGPPLDPLPFTYTFQQFITTGDEQNPYIADGDVTPTNPPFNLSICPALSPDGLRLFYTSTVGDTFSPGDYTTYAVYYTTRPARDAAWEPITQIPGLRSADGVSCVRSVTADGCQLTYYSTTILGPTPDSFIARRANP
jgi:hypothetical protein